MTHRASITEPFDIVRLGTEHAECMRELAAVFGQTFEDEDTWTRQPPSLAYLERLLANPQTIVLAARRAGAWVCGWVAYELPKIEQARSEIYIYDLAVVTANRRQGIARALIAALQPIAVACGAGVIYVQADPSDDPAVALYAGLGTREDVLHFDIPVHAG